MAQDKGAMQSKTILTNTTLAALFPILQAFGVSVTPEITSALLTLVPLVNILLRMVTKGGIKS